jgi:pimeloyl-ACP methyl ester carboxylesterase
MNVKLGQRVSDLIVIVPGILGSRLMKNGDEVWGTTARRLLVNILTFGHFMKSKLAIPADVDPDEPNDGVMASGLITGLNVIPGLLGMDFYDRLRSHLRTDLELMPGQLVEFPYDWRLSCRVNGKLLTDFLDRNLTEYAAQYGKARSKAILVCHSMGGLVARWCADQADGAEMISSLITIGTPHKGSMLALDGIANGVRLPRRLGVDLTAMALSFPSLYELLPTYGCVSLGSDYLPLSTPEIRDKIAALCPLEDLDDVGARIERGLSLHTDLVAGLPQGGPTAYELVCFRGAEQPTLLAGAVGSDGVLVCGETLGGVRHGGDGVVPDDSGVPGFWAYGGSAKSADGKHSTLSGGSSLREELRVTLRHTGRLQAPNVVVVTNLPNDLPAAMGFQVDVSAVPDSEGRRPALNLELVVQPEESSMVQPLRAPAVPPTSASTSYTATVPALPPGLYRLKFQPANRYAAEIDEHEDWLVIHDPTAAG